MNSTVSKQVRGMARDRVYALLTGGCPHRPRVLKLKAANRALVEALRKFIGSEATLSFDTNALPGESLVEYRRRWPAVDPIGFKLVRDGLDAIRQSEVRA